jgi:hypothetical protein
MKSFKDALTTPPLTNAQAREYAENIFQRLHTAEQALLRLEKVLNYAYPLVTPEQQQEMERLLRDDNA